MDVREALIANRLQEEFDLKHQVRITPEKTSGLRGVFYDSPLFTQIDGADTVQFQLVSNAPEFEAETPAFFTYPHPANQDPRQISLHQFFTKYFGPDVEKTALLVPENLDVETALPQVVPGLPVEVPTPPPKAFLS